MQITIFWIAIAAAILIAKKKRAYTAEKTRKQTAFDRLEELLGDQPSEAWPAQTPASRPNGREPEYQEELQIPQTQEWSEPVNLPRSQEEWKEHIRNRKEELKRKRRQNQASGPASTTGTSGTSTLSTAAQSGMSAPEKRQTAAQTAIPPADSDMPTADCSAESVCQDFDLRLAVIYSEIMKPKFEE